MRALFLSVGPDMDVDAACGGRWGRAMRLPQAGMLTA